MKGRLLDAIPLNSLTGVGAAQSSKLAKIGLHTVQDLLLHLPLRYEDRTQLYKIGDLLPALYATVEGEVLNCNITFGGRRMMTCQISDGTGILTMRFFNFSAAMKNSLATGRRVLAYGEAKRGKYGAEMIHPEYRVQGDLSTPELQETLTQVYPTTEGVKQAITEVNPDVIVHCAAWTAVDLAEDDDKVAAVRKVNTNGTQNIANVAKELDVPMVYISTDYVFDGQGTTP